MAEKKSVFAVLSAINCNEHTETRNGLTFLSWAWAWQIVKQNYPNASFTIYESENGIPYFTDGRTGWVKTGVTIEGLEHIEYLPIMDFKHNALPVDRITSTDMNKAIQRSLTKACARHGLGIYIYAGEDLPDTPQEVAETKKETKTTKVSTKVAEVQQNAPVEIPRPMYFKMVENYSKGILARSGADYRSAWITNTNATEEMIQAFDIDVKNYCVANELSIPKTSINI